MCLPNGPLIICIIYTKEGGLKSMKWQSKLMIGVEGKSKPFFLTYEFFFQKHPERRRHYFIEFISVRHCHMHNLSVLHQFNTGQKATLSFFFLPFVVKQNLRRYMCAYILCVCINYIVFFFLILENVLVTCAFHLNWEKVIVISLSGFAHSLV